MTLQETELTPAELQSLKELRQVFLGEESSRRKDYWNDTRLLALYDRTFARRIGWKWDAILDEAKGKGGLPQGLPLVDFGCGTGVAAEKWLERFPTAVVHLFDRSHAAMRFAREKLEHLFPRSTVETHASPARLPADAVWLVSHVVNELGARDSAALVDSLAKASAFVWAEPGNHEVSRTVIETREILRTTHRMLAPCPHQAACGLLGPARKEDWCHHFAQPPGEVHRSSFWKRLGNELKIDMRALPVSYLVGVKGTEGAETSDPRVLGRARTYKGYALAIVCQEKRVAEEKIFSRHHKELVKELEEGAFAQTLKLEILKD